MTDTTLCLPDGEIRGAVSGGVRRFLGIPYAAPPVGTNRFAVPQPVQPWPGVRDATVPGPSAPQRTPTLPALDIVPLVGDGGTRGDDHLTLNIWAPQDAVGRPVMVFIHGGGFVLGSKDVPVQDGTSFARDGVVMVSINYRLGIEGFLPIPGVPTNLGLRDMIAALKWVQANIAAFGGDPDNVTVFGESAGAMATANLVASPPAQGLFRRAIIQSGHGSMVREIPVAQRLVRKLAKLLRVTPDADGFRSVEPMRGVDAIEKLALPWKIDLRDENGFEPVYGISRFIPVYGDDVLPQHPLAALAGGVGGDVEVLIGTNAQEMNLYHVPTGVREKIPGWLVKLLVGRSMPRAREALAAYGLGKPGVKAGHAMTDALSDFVFRWPARQFAAAHRGRTHLYELDWRSPACGGQLGAAHGMELPFVFDTLALTSGARGLTGEAPPQALADHVHRLWVDYASSGALPWPEFGTTRQVYQLEAGHTVSEPVMPAARFLP
ncbi:carboxylesterase family protein [Sphingomonas sp. MG17]|uniref:Carboxylic ester hydrolase n=1 Tax=Sphingomonas tagetis TaxID=2949092 RepID=A0A9X2HCZ3_9SPHN|nr:carboxylesterase family protein [Sphingomonas tagetis]MCP3728821.1 carboxylesterase family protein [Sphingomonas tagetis]